MHLQFRYMLVILAMDNSLKTQPDDTNTMKAKSTLAKMIGKDLTGFTVELLTEVYKTNDDGLKTTSVGFFKSEKIAKAYAGIQADSPWFRTEQVYVLTNGKIGFVLESDEEQITILDDEEAKLKVVEAAKKKLSPAEREALGIE